MVLHDRKPALPADTLEAMARWILLLVSLCATGCDGLPLTRDVQVQQLDSVAAALERTSNAPVLEFTAIPRPELKGSKTWSVRGSRHSGSSNPRTAVMIPLVDEGWTPEQPVAVWVRLDARTDDVDDAKMRAKIDELVAASKDGPLRVNAMQTLPEEVDMEGTNAFTIGAKRAMAEHGLMSPTGAVLATWPAKTKGRLRFAD